MAGRGIVAAGHQLSAEAGVRALQAGGNAVDAALAAMLTSFVVEPLLTGLGAGGHMMVADGNGEPQLLDFFVESPGPRPNDDAAELEAIDVSFGDAQQIFHIGPASCGVYGVPAGVCNAARRWGTIPLTDLAAPAARLAREGVALNAQQAYIARILADLLRYTPECAALWSSAVGVLGEGEVLRNPELGDSLERLANDGAKPFYEGDIAGAVSDTIARLGGWLGRQHLRRYEAVKRPPLKVGYRDRTVLTNPPPSAGGILIAYALSLLNRGPAPPSLQALLLAMEAAQAERTPEFLEGLAHEGFTTDFLSSRLGATTHISVLDADGMACSVTTTNGEGSGIVVPGTGIHLNNMMGEQDLNPLGFHRHPAGRRMPSMMAPSLVMHDGEVELVLGSAGSNRIRSAILQTIVGVVDRGLPVGEAVRAPRVHFEGGIVYHEPGLDAEVLTAPGRQLVRFHDLNLFFGGVQAVQRRDGVLAGAGDPRRGGVALSA
ncbi:MAG TPA: gamma-glutamyltransferase [Solirubrobacteraceae bacterium]